MFDPNPSARSALTDDGAADETELDLAAVIRDSDLPDAVKAVRPVFLSERLIDSAEIERLTTDAGEVGDQTSRSRQLRERRRALQRHAGRTLVCAVIRLPGVLYTIEIDPHTHAVVHWEWQSG